MAHSIDSVSTRGFYGAVVNRMTSISTRGFYDILEAAVVVKLGGTVSQPSVSGAVTKPIVQGTVRIQ